MSIFRIYINFYYYLTLQPATGYTKNGVKSKNVLLKKGEIFFFFFDYCSPVNSDQESALIYGIRYSCQKLLNF